MFWQRMKYSIYEHFHFPLNTFLLSLPSYFSDWELQFFKRLRTGMRRSHLCGGWFQGVAMLCLVLIELGRCVSVLWKVVLAQQRNLWGQMLQPMQHNVGGCSLEGEVPSWAPGSWWELCASGARGLGYEDSSQVWPLHPDFSFESQTCTWVARI